MRRRLFLNVTGFFLLSVLSACRNSGDRVGIMQPSDSIISERLVYENISGITAASPALVVIYEQADSSTINVRGPENVVKSLRIDCRRDNTVIFEIDNYLEFDFRDESEYVNIKVTAPQINEIDAMNGGIIEIKNPMTAGRRINIGSYSHGRIHIRKLTAENIRIESFTGSEVVIDSLTAHHISREAFTGAKITIKKNVN